MVTFGVTLGERIKARRIELGLSQQELAELLDVGLQLIKDYEAGRKRPSLDRLPSVAAALRTRVGWLFGEKEEEGHTVAAASNPDRVRDAKLDSRSLLALFTKQQEQLIRQTFLLEEQTGLLERQRQDASRLTELIARQQEIYAEERDFQRRLQLQQTEKADKQAKRIEQLEKVVESLTAAARPGRPSRQLLEPPAVPGGAGG